MRVRFPRPARGWPEFVDDVVIVVLGVILALSAQELAQRQHERSAYRETRNSVFNEVGENLGRLQKRLATQNCINARLRAFQALLHQSTTRKPLPSPLWVGRPQFWGLPAGKWQAALAAQQADAFSNDELGRLSVLYMSFDQIREFQADEQRAWARLRAMEDIGRIEQPLHDELVLALKQARLTNYQVYVATTQAKAESAEIGVKPIGNPRASLSVCLPLQLSRTEALKRIGRSDNEEP